VAEAAQLRLVLVAAVAGIAAARLLRVPAPALVGERFRGTTLTVLVGALRGAVEGIVIAISVSLAFAWLGTVPTGLPFGQLWLAMAPGGIETMAILAFVLQLDATSVGAHHVVRFVALSLLVPFWPAPRQDRRISRSEP